MFQPWTKKEIVKFILSFAVFFALVLATQLPGFLSPLYWAVFPVFSAFAAAGPADVRDGYEAGIRIDGCHSSVMVSCLPLHGELGMPLMRA